MRNIIVALFAASSLFVAAPLPVLAGVDVAAVCDGTVPEAWQRPGGFCDQNDFNKSLTDPSNSQSCDPITIGMNGRDDEIRMLVAEPEKGCCVMNSVYEFVPSAGRVILAYDPCCYGSLTSPEFDNLDMDQRDRVVLVAC